MDTATATLRFLRMSPRKVRLVVDLVRGKTVSDARAQLMHVNKAASLPVRKLLDSAVANAVNNHGLVGEALYIQTVTVDQGPTLKRFTPRAFGRAGAIRKRTSHVTLIVAERADLKPVAAPKKRATAKTKVKTAKAVDADASTPESTNA